MTTDIAVFEAIQRLVDQEHDLRAKHLERRSDHVGRVARLRELEAELDQCWDLLRQRRALRSAGRDTETATVRPVTQIQAYRQ